MALSDWRPEHQESWVEAVIPSFAPRKRSRLLTPLGWFVVLSIASVAAGASIGFLI